MKSMKHCLACCSVCSICQARIKSRYFDEHFAACQRELEQGVIGKILPHIQNAWCKDTCSPGDVARWTPDNPCIGQCAVTALLIQELLGGELMPTSVEGFGSHYYNRLPSGDDLDLTRGQFPADSEVPPGEPRTREYVLDSPRAIAAGTRQRYELLKQRYTTDCAGQ